LEKPSFSVVLSRFFRQISPMGWGSLGDIGLAEKWKLSALKGGACEVHAGQSEEEDLHRISKETWKGPFEIHVPGPILSAILSPFRLSM
jgi:hypothetical protein